MKMKDLVPGEDYALIERTYSNSRRRLRHVPGFETFKPYAKRVLVIGPEEVHVSRFDYTAGKKVSKPMKVVRVAFYWDDGSLRFKDGKKGQKIKQDYSNVSTTTVMPTNIVAPWSDYAKTLKEYNAVVEKQILDERKTRENLARDAKRSVDKIFKMLKPLLPRGAKKDAFVWYSLYTHDNRYVIDLSQTAAEALASIALPKVADKKA
jgi:hypothetical protein